MLYSWFLGQSQLTGVEAQRLLPTINDLLPCRDYQIFVFDYVLVQKPDAFVCNFYKPNRLKIIKSLNDEHTKSLCFSRVPVIFTQRRKSISSVFAKRIYPVSLQTLLQILRCPPIKLANSHIFILDGIGTAVLLSRFAQQPPKSCHRTQRWLYLTRRCRKIYNSSFESECQNQKEEMLGPLQNLNGISYKLCTLTLLLLIDLCAICQRRSVYQYRR